MWLLKTGDPLLQVTTAGLTVIVYKIVDLMHKSGRILSFLLLLI